MTRHASVESYDAFAAIIFDCDGTLADTAPFHLYALQTSLRELGHEMEARWYYQRVGLSGKQLFDEFDALIGTQVDRLKCRELSSAAYHSRVNEIQEILAVASIARAQKGKRPLAVASSGRRKIVTATLEATKLINLFDAIVTVEDVEHPKPAPDIYMEAARQLGVEPASCLVFEDSDEGLEAASRAGMQACDVRHMYMPSWRLDI